MKTLLLTLLLLVGGTYSKNFTLNRNTPNPNVSALIESFADYLDNPMSWCDINPTSVDMEKMVTNKHKIIIISKISCTDEFQKKFSKAIIKAIGTFNPDTGEWNGIIGSIGKMAKFRTAFEKRYPWITTHWVAYHGHFWLTMNGNYGALSETNALYYKLMINGHQAGVYGVKKNKYVRATVPLYRVSLNNLFIGEAYVAPFENSRYMPSKYEFEVDFHYRLTDIEHNNLDWMNSVDIDIVQVFNVNTRGYLNRGYQFMNSRH